MVDASKSNSLRDLFHRSSFIDDSSSAVLPSLLSPSLRYITNCDHVQLFQFCRQPFDASSTYSSERPTYSVQELLSSPNPCIIRLSFFPYKLLPSAWCCCWQVWSDSRPATSSMLIEMFATIENDDGSFASNKLIIRIIINLFLNLHNLIFTFMLMARKCEAGSGMGGAEKQNMRDQ